MVKTIVELALRFVVFFILIYFLTFGFTEVNPGIILTLLAILVMTVFVRVFALLRKLPAIHPVKAKVIGNISTLVVILIFAYINKNFAEANLKLFMLSLGVLAIIATKNIIEYKMLTK